MIAIALLPSALVALQSPSAPPPTRRDPVVEVFHGQSITDDYRWLEALDSESAEVEAWTTAQNDFTRARLDALPCRSALESALRPLMEIGAISAPRMRGNLYFYTERTGSQNQPVVKVRQGFDGAPRDLLDLNSLDQTGLTSLDWMNPSRDGALLAFGLSRSGSEMSELHILDTATGRWLADQISGKVSFSSWTPDGKGFLYSVLRDPKDPYSREVRFHEVGTSPRFDPVLLKQENPSEIPFAALSTDGRWLFTGLFRGWQANDLSVMRFDDWRRTGTLAPIPIAKGLDARTQPASTLGDTLWATTTFNAPNTRLVRIDLNAPGDPSAWQTVVPERADAVLQGAQLARDLLVLDYEQDASSRLTRVSLDGSPRGDIALPGLGTASLSTEEERSEAFLTFTSFTEPRSIYRLDLAEGAEPSSGIASSAARATLPPPSLALWARPEVPVDPSKYEVQQVRAKSRDGTMIPMFIVTRKGVTPQGDNPCLLYGYGGFNVSLTPFFNPTIIPWLDAGGVWVQANLRGGGEYGEAWHRAGMRDKKQNVFDDFYACAEWLIEQRWTNSRRLVIEGGSNGGLLTGVAVTQRPELFAAAIVGVPLLDMLRYDRFLLAKFWVPEYGSAEDPEAYGWLRAYSPYHHVQQGTAYPAVFLHTGENDSRVHPLHARKMAARLQAMTTSDPETKPILLWVDRDGGHGQGKPLSLRLRDRADQWAFVMWQTGLCR
ncbi:MAG: S9 family peptidase [Phycisphaeraceae bacterium]|nr:S9 family peptidase [Phycisphaeraceae bacterium]